MVYDEYLVYLITVNQTIFEIMRKLSTQQLKSHKKCRIMILIYVLILFLKTVALQKLCIYRYRKCI